MQPNAHKALIYPGIMTQHSALDSSEAQMRFFFSSKDTRTANEIKALIQGVHSRFSSHLQKVLTFSLPLLSIFKPDTRLCFLANIFQSHANPSKSF